MLIFLCLAVAEYQSRFEYTLAILFNKVRFCGEELLTPRPNPKLEDNPLSAVRDCLFNIFAATLHIGGCSSIRNLRTRHTVVTETHLSSHGHNINTTSNFKFHISSSHLTKMQKVVYYSSIIHFAHLPFNIRCFSDGKKTL